MGSSNMLGVDCDVIVLWGFLVLPDSSPSKGSDFNTWGMGTRYETLSLHRAQCIEKGTPISQNLSASNIQLDLE